MTNSQRAFVKRRVTQDSVYQALKWSGNLLLGKRRGAAKWETVFTPEQAERFLAQQRKLARLADA